MAEEDAGSVSGDVDVEQPWLGLHAFTPLTQRFFFGRTAETDDVVARIHHKPLTILFGQSGLGKSSIIGAGVIPRLQAEGLTPVRVHLRYTEKDPPLERQVLDMIAEARPLPQAASADSLWLLAHDPDCGLLQYPTPGIVLILDQFEEIFTLGEYPSLRERSAAFRDLLTDLVENRVPASLRPRIEANEALGERLDYSARPIRVMLSLREDYLHALERWRPQMPSLMDNRFELRLLSGPQALSAILGPSALRCKEPGANGVPPIVTRETAEAIVRFVAGVGDDVPIAEIDAVPPLLSLLCQQLNAKRPLDEKRAPAPGTTFGTEHLSGKADSILVDFYNNCFRGIPEEMRAGVKRVVEDSLVRSGIRETLSWESARLEILTFCGAGADAEGALRHLVNERLLVVEERRESRVQSKHQRDVRKVELTHDILVRSVSVSRDERLKREAASAERAKRLSQIELARPESSPAVTAADDSHAKKEVADFTSSPGVAEIPFKYWAFLACAHRNNRDPDRCWATWLHTHIETFEIPPDLIGRVSETGVRIPQRLFPVFQDEAELPADADLASLMRHALQQSAAMIVICSPAAAQSHFVNEEIRYFKERGNDRILAVIVDGEPNAAERSKAERGISPESECFPPALRYGARNSSGGVDWEARIEPIAADLRVLGQANRQGYTNVGALQKVLREDNRNASEVAEISRDYQQRLDLAGLKIISGIIGIPLGELTRRDHAYELARQKRRARVLRGWLVTVGLLAVLAVAAGIVAYKQSIEAQNETKRSAELEAQLSRIQQALAKLPEATDPSKDPISKWSKERLESELARQLNLDVTDLRGFLAAGEKSTDPLLAGRALLALGKFEEASAKFDLVLHQENAVRRTVILALEGKAQVAYDTAQYGQALEHYLRAASLVDQRQDPIMVANLKEEAASIQLRLARYSEAEGLLRQVIKVREGSLGPDHPDVAKALSGLVQVLIETNRLQEAEQLAQRALKIRETVLGSNRPELARAMVNLAQIYRYTARYAEAQRYMIGALEIDKAAYGPEHPVVARDLNNLSELLQATGRLAEADEMAQRALRIDEAILGPKHPDVARDLSNLAQLRLSKGEHAGAESLLQRALQINEAVYGEDHPAVARDLNNLGQLLVQKDDFAGAEIVLRRALAINETIYHPDHPSVAQSLDNLGWVLQKAGRSAEAEPLERRALEIYAAFQWSTGHEHSSSQATATDYLRILADTGLKDDEQRARLVSLVESAAKLKGKSQEDVSAVVARMIGPFDVTVTDVLSEGQGSSLGIQTGDIVRRYDGEGITRADQLISRSGQVKGGAIPLEIQRGNEILKLTAGSGRLGLRLENRPRNAAAHETSAPLPPAGSSK